MKRSHYLAFFVLSAVSAACTDSSVDTPEPNAVCFSASQDWPDEDAPSRSKFPMGFNEGDDVEVFACHTEQADASSSFTSNFMNRQIVHYDGTAWTYSPTKYWPLSGQIKFHGWAPTEANNYLKRLSYNGTTGLPTFNYECLTGFEPFYEANTIVKANNGELSGDDISGFGRLQLIFHPVPNRYDIVATADTRLYDSPDPNPTGEYQECRFLIRSFKFWGVYKKAKYDMATDRWYGQEGQYTHDEPLDMTPYLNMVKVEDAVPGYKYEPDPGYDYDPANPPGSGYHTEYAVVVGESKEGQHTQLFSKPGFFIPADIADIPGNEAGFEITYVVLTNKPGTHDYKETGIITRSGSLKEAFNDKHNGRVHYVTDINLHFKIEELTITVNLYDYIYKPMF